MGWYTFAWVWFVLGILSGALLGLGFHHPEFWGGYDSWRRRLARLGHISFFGTGGLLLAMALTLEAVPIGPSPHAWLVFLPLWATLIGAVTMPLVCFLSAWHKPLRVGFAIPVLSLSSGVVGFTTLLFLHAL